MLKRDVREKKESIECKKQGTVESNSNELNSPEAHSPNDTTKSSDRAKVWRKICDVMIVDDSVLHVRRCVEE